MLRVACRTAEWPSYLELELEKLYRQDLCIVELAPLREEDARVAAEQAGIDVQTFFRQINDLNAVPFARKPSTLVFLLSIVAQGGTLPKTQWQLYEQGCRIRCDEYNKSRIASHKTANLTPDQLLEAASRIAALCIFTDQQKLHAESEAVIELWNYTSTKPRQYWPQDENDFSNWLKRRLEEEIVARGVVVAREVEIRRKRSSRGERTDLYVVCKHPTTNEKIVVVVEVKGCWNPDLKSAMKTQLADRYLKDNFYDHGVYLVGWFLCDKWRNQDRRKRKVPFKRLDQARRFFKKQAHSLASEQTFLKALVMDIALR